MSDLSKAVDLVRQARFDSWRRMAAELPDHHVLAVEMFRVDRNTTVSIFTLVRNGNVVQEVLQGDGRGLNVRPVAPRVEQCQPLPIGRDLQVESLMIPAPAAPTDGGVTAYTVAYGEPPPQRPTEPGIVAAGGVGLANAFDTTELLVGGSGSTQAP
jgi:hypothetical protein